MYLKLVNTFLVVQRLGSKVKQYIVIILYVCSQAICENIDGEALQRKEGKGSHGQEVRRLSNAFIVQLLLPFGCYCYLSFHQF